MDGLRFVNEGSTAFASRRSTAEPGRSRQPLSARQHRPRQMPLSRLLPLCLLAAGSVFAVGQATAVAPSGTGADLTVSATVRPALAQVAQTLNGINVHRWKAPSPVRDAADQDIASIQRDLSGTLAGLLQEADAAPNSVPEAFSVYRNVDALYDTLLRVVETAELAAPDNEEVSLETALKTLENARGSLGDAILNDSATEQAELTRLRTAISLAAAAQRAPVKTTVIDDGPAPGKVAHHPHTTTSKRPQTEKKSSPPQATKPSSANTNPQ
jgi:hypothetical protein